ncbi:hypothetical protein [Actinomadura harenae]|uniref:hypothetical protein n=1 Tax=Actinomadura harenae TaxID=2483351 RepID=UPI0018F3D015|nr:hypothetical protein [Actinomadura harenae]
MPETPTPETPPPDWQQRVDTHPAVDQPGHPDEEQILQRLYGAPGPDGIYRGEGPQ